MIQTNGCAFSGGLTRSLRRFPNTERTVSQPKNNRSPVAPSVTKTRGAGVIGLSALGCQRWGVNIAGRRC